MRNQFLHQNEASFFTAQNSCARYFNSIARCFASVFCAIYENKKAPALSALVQIESRGRILASRLKRKSDRAYLLKMRSAASIVASISASLCAAETKPASKAEGAR